MSPRPRKSLDEHRLQNTKPQYVEPSAALIPTRPRYPRDLSPAAKRVFKSISRLLERRRSLTEADGELIRLLALTYVRHERAIAKVAQEGEITTYFRLDNRGESVPSERPNLWLKVAQEAEKQMIAIYDRLGLTPMNRAKVKPTEQPKAPTTTTQEEEALFSREASASANDEIDLSSIDETSIQ